MLNLELKVSARKGATKVLPSTPGVVTRGGLLRRLDVADPKVAALDLTKTDDVRQALSRLCGIELVTACLKGPDAACGACPNCNAAAQLPRLREPWTRGKLNQALVLYRRPAMGEGFFDAFFPPDATNSELLAGITQFRSYAMLRFGGFRPAFQRLAGAKLAEIQDLLREYNRDAAQTQREYNDRTHGQDLIADDGIRVEDRWYLGYISDSLLLRDFMKEEAMRWRASGVRPAPSPSTARIRADAPAQARYDKDVAAYRKDISKKQARAWAKRLDEKRAELEQISVARATALKTGQQNSAAYLAASHIDVYVATSMRESWEYEAMGRVVQQIFAHESLRDLRLSKFDPTLSYYESRYDKGLVEGLMIHRASATIYMVQETDTLGKDSELAATLAYGKPVIAYVPRYTRAQLIRELRRSRLRRTFTRMLMLLGDGLILPTSSGAKAGLALLRRYEPAFILDREEERAFRERHKKTLQQVYRVVADGELASLNRRAGTLVETHPLGLQLQQGRGVACGVLLARTPERCAMLLKQLLGNELQLRIEEEDFATLLVECGEVGSEATYRVVTKDPVLTNAFWTHYRTFETPSSA